MAGNSFGTLFRYTSWGESHGPAIGVVVDGVPPKIPLAEADIQHWLDRRRPGQSRYTTQRREPDEGKVRSGGFEGQTPGPPIQLLIANVDPRAKEYLFWCPDRATATRGAEYLDGVRKSGSSAGAVIEIVASGVPAGLGEPVYDKLDGDLARAMMTINAVKGVEIGAGFGAASLPGEENPDEIRIRDGKIVFLSNNAGGSLGGISTGQDILVRLAVKPTSSILKPMRTIDANLNEVEIETPGPHHPCVVIRPVPAG